MDSPISKRMKILLLQTMQELGISKSELARRMGKSPQSVSRLTNINHTSNANHMQEAFKTMGKTVKLVEV